VQQEKVETAISVPELLRSSDLPPLQPTGRQGDVKIRGEGIQELADDLRAAICLSGSGGWRGCALRPRRRVNGMLLYACGQCCETAGSKVAKMLARDGLGAPAAIACAVSSVTCVLALRRLAT
ncbi:hypothetical protein, partial [Streptomyces malaysiensis]